MSDTFPVARANVLGSIAASATVANGASTTSSAIPVQYGAGGFAIYLKKTNAGNVTGITITATYNPDAPGETATVPLTVAETIVPSTTTIVSGTAQVFAFSPPACQTMTITVANASGGDFIGRVALTYGGQ